MLFENFKMDVQLLSNNAKIPTRGTKESAGLDFYTPIDIIINPWSDILIPLDLKIYITEGYALIMKEKSGIAFKKKCDIGACVIDSDYRGNIHAHLINNSGEYISFLKGDKICQGIIVPIWMGDINLVDKIDGETERGSGGFGSTGR